MCKNVNFSGKEWDLSKSRSCVGATKLNIWCKKGNENSAVRKRALNFLFVTSVCVSWSQPVAGQIPCVTWLQAGQDSSMDMLRENEE